MYQRKNCLQEQSELMKTSMWIEYPANCYRQLFDVLELFDFDQNEVVHCAMSNNTKTVATVFKNNEDLWNGFRPYLRIDKMTPLECACFMLQSDSSYTTLKRNKMCLDSFGYNALHSNSTVSTIRTLFSQIFVHRFKVRAYPQNRAVAVDFEALFSQVNSWILNGEYELERGKEDRKYLTKPVNILELCVVWRTDGTPSSNGTKPFLVFGISVTYRGCELSFPGDIKFIPAVVQFSKESNASFEFWGSLAREAFMNSGLAEAQISFGMDGGGFFKWQNSMKVNPYCSCKGFDDWSICCCSLFQAVSDTYKDKEPWNVLKHKRKDLDFSINPILKDLSEEQLEIFKKIPTDFYKTCSLSLEKSGALDEFMKLDCSANGSKITAKRIRELLGLLDIPLPTAYKDGKKIYPSKDILLAFALDKQTKMMSDDNAGIVDNYWLLKFVICIMHGKFRLTSRKLMLLFGACKDSDLFYPNFQLTLSSYHVNFRIYTTKGGKQKISPLNGHCCDFFLDNEEAIVRSVLPPKLFIGMENDDWTVEGLQGVIEDKLKKKNINCGIPVGVDIIGLQKLYVDSIGGNHKRADEWVSLFQRATKHYKTLKKGISKF